MSKKQIALDTAEFLDSAQARSIDGLNREQVKKIAGIFLSICYEDLAKKPHLLDGHDMHAALGHLMPGRLGRKDPLAPHVPAVLTALFEHQGERHVVANAFEIAHSLANTTDEFLEAVRTGENQHHRAVRQEPVVHQVEKLGRNDPCSCGSGKKYKKCHGK